MGAYGHRLPVYAYTAATGGGTPPEILSTSTSDTQCEKGLAWLCTNVAPKKRSALLGMNVGPTGPI